MLQGDLTSWESMTGVQHVGDLQCQHPARWLMTVTEDSRCCSGFRMMSRVWCLTTELLVLQSK